MMAILLEKPRKRCGSFCIAACLLSAPLVMGAALAVDLGRIDNARRLARAALESALSASLDAEGQLDIGRARELYTSTLKLPSGQSSTPPDFRRDVEGRWTAGVRTATRLTFGGILLPTKFYSAVTVVTAPSSRAGR